MRGEEALRRSSSALARSGVIDQRRASFMSTIASKRGLPWFFCADIWFLAPTPPMRE